MTDNLINLDEYRELRIKEGTWPPDDTKVREYWLNRLSIKNALSKTGKGHAK